MLLEHHLNIKDYNVITTNPDRKNIFYKVINTKNKKLELEAYLSFHKNKSLKNCGKKLLTHRNVNCRQNC